MEPQAFLPQVAKHRQHIVHRDIAASLCEKVLHVPAHGEQGRTRSASAWMCWQSGACRCAGAQAVMWRTPLPPPPATAHVTPHIPAALSQRASAGIGAPSPVGVVHLEMQLPDKPAQLCIRCNGPHERQLNLCCINVQLDDLEGREGIAYAALFEYF